MSLVKQGHLELVDWTMSSQLFSISKSGNSNTSTGNLCQCSVTPKIEIEKRKTTCVVPMALVLSMSFPRSMHLWRPKHLMRNTRLIFQIAAAVPET